MLLVRVAIVSRVPKESRVSKALCVSIENKKRVLSAIPSRALRAVNILHALGSIDIIRYVLVRVAIALHTVVTLIERYLNAPSLLLADVIPGGMVCCPPSRRFVCCLCQRVAATVVMFCDCDPGIPVRGASCERTNKVLKGVSICGRNRVTRRSALFLPRTCWIVDDCSGCTTACSVYS